MEGLIHGGAYFRNFTVTIIVEFRFCFQGVSARSHFFESGYPMITVHSIILATFREKISQVVYSSVSDYKLFLV